MEVEAIFAVALSRTSNLGWHSFWITACEIQALEWESVDFDKKQILICAAFKRGIGKIEPYPKQRRQGFAPMPDALVEYLGQRKNVASGPYVASAFKGGMLEYKKLYDGLRTLCAEAGVKRISPHELRHSCSEIWLEQGASLEDIRRIFNQKSTETTRRYIHRSESRLLAMGSKIVIPSAPKLELVKMSDVNFLLLSGNLGTKKGNHF